jgi:large subunit ribosomal protein L15
MAEKKAKTTEAAAGSALKVHHLRPAPGAKTARTRVGRGEGSKGKTAGRGTKGSKARTTVALGFEGGQMPLHRRVPKRGFHNPFRVEYEVVNLDTLGLRFDAGTVITPDLLREHGLVARGSAKVKVLGRGEIAKALTVRAHKFSGKAAEKIAAAGGATEQL